MARKGYTTGVVDLTGGEMGTRGDVETRRKESQEAARVMGAAVRLRAELRDGHLSNTDQSRRVIVELLRMLRPRVVILPFPIGRHPDHRVASELGRDACFLANLAKYDASGEPHTVEKVLYALAYREDPVKPSFVVDIADEFETKLRAIRCYASQFDGTQSAGEIFPTGQPLYDLIRVQHAHYGSLIRAAYGEPFVTQETVRVDDVVTMGVRSL
jgi:bacillithiol biosynthesis deacetylase BshB1